MSVIFYYFRFTFGTFPKLIVCQMLFQFNNNIYKIITNINNG